MRRGGRGSVFEMIGVDARALSVYRAMLREPAWGVAEIAADLGMAFDEVRSALDELARVKLLRSSWDRAGMLRAVRPEVGLMNLLEEQRVKLAAEMAQVEQGRAAVRGLIEELTPLQPQSVLARLDGLDGVRGTLEQLARDARVEALSFVPGGGQGRASLDASRPLDEDALARGVRLRTLYTDSAARDRPTSAHVAHLVALGAEARTVPVLPIRMLVVDAEIAVLPVDPDKSAAGALVVRERGIVAAVRALFHSYWDISRPFGAPVSVGVSLDEPTRQQRAVLDLLARGMKDESIARSLGTSVRTVRRVVAELMELLDAESRFEAGVNAVRRGWLTAEAVPARTAAAAG